MGQEVIVETKRMILRKFQTEDLEGMWELDSNPEVHRYLGNDPVTDKNFLKGVIQSLQTQYAENGIARWAVINKETGEFMGWSGLKYVTETTNGLVNFYDLGYRFKQKYWGMGYGFESAEAALRYGFDVLQLQELYASAHVHNQASNAILKRLGFEFQNRFFYEKEENNWYKITRRVID